MGYGVVIPCRERLDNIKHTLDSLYKQTIAPKQVIIVDDGSEHGLEKLVRDYGYDYIRFGMKHEESWVGKPELSLVFNAGVKALDMSNLDHFMILGSDTILEEDYARKVIASMNDKIVIASGIIVGEESNIPRGSGRVFKVSFWNEHIKEFPYLYIWESYPLFKAEALGFKIHVCKDAKMYVNRKTTNYKPLYGRAMKELGYSPLYVFGRSMVYAIKSKDLASAIRVMIEYLRWNDKVIDEDISRYIKRYQQKRILQFLRMKG